jgi:hypothetical protein
VFYRTRFNSLLRAWTKSLIRTLQARLGYHDLLTRSGYITQPRVAAFAATLGTVEENQQPQGVGVSPEKRLNPFGVGMFYHTVDPSVAAKRGNPGLSYVTALACFFPSLQ